MAYPKTMKTAVLLSVVFSRDCTKGQALAMVSVEVAGLEFADRALYNSVYTFQQLSWQRSCCGIRQDRFARECGNGDQQECKS